jgi:hypothetical protein
MCNMLTLKIDGQGSSDLAFRGAALTKNDGMNADYSPLGYMAWSLLWPTVSSTPPVYSRSTTEANCQITAND